MSVRKPHLMTKRPGYAGFDPVPDPEPERPIRLYRRPEPTDRTPHLKRATVFGRLPAIYRRAFEVPTTEQGDPGTPPQGFVRGTTSGVEWDVYYWLWYLLACEGNPRASGPPFYGGRGALGTFSYQVSFFGGRHSPGGAIPDFAVIRPTRAVIIELEGEWQHVFTNSAKIERELHQTGRIAGQIFEVVRIYEQHILASPATARRVLADAIEGVSWVGPIWGGTPFRIRA